MPNPQKRRETLLKKYGSELAMKKALAQWGGKGGKAKVPTKGFGTKPYIRKSFFDVTSKYDL